MASSDLVWELVKRNNSFLQKRPRGQFSLEANNLKGKNCYQYSGIVHKQSIGVEAAKDGKGVVLVTKNSRNKNRPAKSFKRTQLGSRGGSRKALQTVRKIVRKSCYRPELEMLALRRTSALLRSQKPAGTTTAKK